MPAGDLAAYQASGGASRRAAARFTREVQVYDSLGRPHDLTMAFLRNGAANSWAVEVSGATGGRRHRAHTPTACWPRAP